MAPRKTVRKGYKPAALVQATLKHVASPDTFMTFFFSYIYEKLNSEEGLAVGSDITHALLCFDSFSSWEPEHINQLIEGLEKFAEYMVGNFLLPRLLIPYLYYRNHNEHMLIRNCSQSFIGQDSIANAHIVIVAAELKPDRNKAGCIRFTTDLPCSR